MPLHSIISIITLFFAIILSCLVLAVDFRGKNNRYFFYLGLSIVIWILCNILADIISVYEWALFFARISMVWVALLPIFFHLLTKNLYPCENIKQEKRVFLTLLLSLVLISIFSQTKINIIDLIIYPGAVGFHPGPLYYFLFFYLVFGFGSSSLLMIRSGKHLQEKLKLQLRFILWGLIICLIPALITGIIFPILGYSLVSLYTPSTSIIFLLFIAYAITKHQLFNIRIIAIELVIFGLWLTILIRILLSSTLREVLTGTGFLIITIVFGFTLIRSAIHEMQQREKIASLRQELSGIYKKDSLQ